MGECRKCGQTIAGWKKTEGRDGKVYNKPFDEDGRCHWDTCTAKSSAGDGGGGPSSAGEVLKQMQQQTDLLAKLVELMQRLVPNDTIKIEPKKKRETTHANAEPETVEAQEDCPF